MMATSTGGTRNAWGDTFTADCARSEERSRWEQEQAERHGHRGRQCREPGCAHRTWNETRTCTRHGGDEGETQTGTEQQTETAEEQTRPDGWWNEWCETHDEPRGNCDRMHS